MSAEEFRRAGHRMIDEIADFYAKGIETAPVLSQVKPGYLHAALPKNAPESPESVDAIMKGLVSLFHELRSRAHPVSCLQMFSS